MAQVTISAKVILCSQVDWQGYPPIWTLQLRYPRFIHAEFMTHRAFSRNASSSRAVPIKKLAEEARNEPAMPVYWGRNQKGMQADVELNDKEIAAARFKWREAAGVAADLALSLETLGLHKQIANRVLEPFSHISVIVTATEFDNFFQLRDHRDAQPEIRALARKMRDAMTDVYFEDKINKLEPGQWHLPYVRPTEMEYSDQIKQKISAARCARISYMTHEGKPSTVEQDIALYDQLIVQKPAHASPIEHQAMAMSATNAGIAFIHKNYANFKGWQSLRYQMEARGEL